MIITRKELKEYLFTDGQLYPKITNTAMVKFC